MTRHAISPRFATSTFSMPPPPDEDAVGGGEEEERSRAARRGSAGTGLPAGLPPRPRRRRWRWRRREAITQWRWLGWWRLGEQ